MSAADHTTERPTVPEILAAVDSAPPTNRIPGRNRTKADLVVVEVRGRAVAVKDYRPRPFWIRNTAGRFLVRRECAAYRAAGDLPGLARFQGRVGPFALATDWVDARSLRDRRGERLDPAVFATLGEVLEALHRRGVALGDLHHRDVLLSDGGDVTVVDLATAWVLGPRPSPMRRRIFLRLKENDHVALARMRARMLHGREADLEHEVSVDAARRHRRSRRWKALWNRMRGRR